MIRNYVTQNIELTHRILNIVKIDIFKKFTSNPNHRVRQFSQNIQYIKPLLLKKYILIVFFSRNLHSKLINRNITISFTETCSSNLSPLELIPFHEGSPRSPTILISSLNFAPSPHQSKKRVPIRCTRGIPEYAIRPRSNGGARSDI